MDEQYPSCCKQQQLYREGRGYSRETSMVDGSMGWLHFPEVSISADDAMWRAERPHPSTVFKFEVEWRKMQNSGLNRYVFNRRHADISGVSPLMFRVFTSAPALISDLMELRVVLSESLTTMPDCMVTCSHAGIVYIIYCFTITASLVCRQYQYSDLVDN